MQKYKITKGWPWFGSKLIISIKLFLAQNVKRQRAPNLLSSDFEAENAALTFRQIRPAAADIGLGDRWAFRDQSTNRCQPRMCYALMASLTNQNTQKV